MENEDINAIYQTLEQENITDPKSRDYHSTVLKDKGVRKKTNQGTGAECFICHQPVSSKVIAFCQSNKKFNGKIYCFDHQKQVK